MRKFAPILDIMYLSRIGANRYCEKMATSLENIDKSKVSADRIEGLDAKIQAELSTAVTGAASTIITSDLTANKILVSNANGKVAASANALTDKQDTLVSGINIKTINNTSILGSGNISISTTPSIDSKSITTNASDQIQTVGVINSRDSSTAIKTWTGTKAQYNTILSKDANTLYNITDDTDITLTILEALYPVGSIYITTANSCPLSTLISGSTWTLVSSGRVLQGADSGHSAGTNITAGLPNITGNIGVNADDTTVTNGAFGITSSGRGVNGASWGNTGYTDFDASRSSSIYGNSSTVQPPAYAVNIFERTA